MTIGDRIRQRRKELGLTQEELANKMGYSSRTAISNVEKGGEDLTSTRIEKYAKALECTPSYLMGWTGTPNQTQYNLFDVIGEDGDKFREEQFRNRFDIEVELSPRRISKEEYIIIECYRALSDKEKD